MLYLSIISTAALWCHATAANDILAKGFNLPQSDLWTLQGLRGLTVFSNFSAESLVENLDCPHVAETINENYTTSNSWYQAFSKSIGINRDASWHGLDVSVGHSLGQSDAYMWWDELESTYVETYNIQNCQIISQEWSPFDNLSQDFIDALQSLPTSPDDEATMELWQAAFIDRFGTHYAVQTSHGAMIKSLTSVETSCQTSMDCLMIETCHDLAFVAIYGSAFCKDEDHCDLSEGCEETLNVECTVNGGDPSTSSSALCSADATEEQYDAFLSSGDLESSTSAISIEFSSLSDLVAGAGFYDQFYQVSQAIAYAGCSSPWEWREVPSSASTATTTTTSKTNASSTHRSDTTELYVLPGQLSHSCQCALECQNGGVLDPASCTCQCAGDEAHGWRGVDCTESYGKCQCAPGSQSNGADQCCVDGNICGSAHESPECSDTEVCCNKDQYAACCPFGYSCDPQATSVECVPNNPVQVYP